MHQGRGRKVTKQKSFAPVFVVYAVVCRNIVWHTIHRALWLCAMCAFPEALLYVLGYFNVQTQRLPSVFFALEACLEQLVKRHILTWLSSVVRRPIYSPLPFLLFCAKSRNFCREAENLKSDSQFCCISFQFFPRTTETMLDGLIIWSAQQLLKAWPKIFLHAVRGLSACRCAALWRIITFLCLLF